MEGTPERNLEWVRAFGLTRLVRATEARRVRGHAPAFRAA
jgi:hypothetical protein